MAAMKGLRVKFNFPRKSIGSPASGTSAPLVVLGDSGFKDLQLIWTTHPDAIVAQVRQLGLAAMGERLLPEWSDDEWEEKIPNGKQEDVKGRDKSERSPQSHGLKRPREEDKVENGMAKVSKQTKEDDKVVDDKDKKPRERKQGDMVEDGEAQTSRQSIEEGHVDGFAHARRDSERDGKPDSSAAKSVKRTLIEDEKDDDPASKPSKRPREHDKGEQRPQRVSRWDCSEPPPSRDPVRPPAVGKTCVGVQVELLPKPDAMSKKEATGTKDAEVEPPPAIGPSGKDLSSEKIHQALDHAKMLKQRGENLKEDNKQTWTVKGLGYYVLSCIQFAECAEMKCRYHRRSQHELLYKQTADMCDFTSEHAVNSKGSRVAKNLLRVLVGTIGALCRLHALRHQQDALKSYCHRLSSGKELASGPGRNDKTPTRGGANRDSPAARHTPPNNEHRGRGQEPPGQAAGEGSPRSVTSLVVDGLKEYVRANQSLHECGAWLLKMQQDPGNRESSSCMKAIKLVQSLNVTMGLTNLYTVMGQARTAVQAVVDLDKELAQKPAR